MRFVDISNWKADVDVSKIDADGVVVQCTWGAGELTTDNGLVDSVWVGADAKIQAAAARGMAVGYMHYIRGVGAAEEALFFAEHTKGYLKKFVPCVDWEAADNAAWGDRSYLDEFLYHYIRTTGVKPLVYAQRSEIPYIKDIAAKHDCGIWEACYATDDAVGWQDADSIWSYVAFPMRQYTSNGHIDGYAGSLDLNYFAGDKAAWDKYAGVGADTPVNPAPPIIESPAPTVVACTYDVAVDALNVRTEPSVNAAVAAQYVRGQQIVLDGWGAYADGYLWGRYVGASSGEYRYVAVGTESGDEWYLTIR